MEGTRLLWLALQKSGLTMQEARKSLGLAEGVLNRILVGDRKAGLQVALLLEKEFNVPLASWSKKPRRDFQLPEFLGAA
jgi:plasmid maintenance system antidote protein VapI